MSIVQLAWVVKDLEEAALRFNRTTGAGPFLIMRHIPLDRYRHRGVPAETDFSIAVAQSGEVQIELIEQHDRGASAYRDLVPAGAEGFHHMALIVEDVRAEVARYAGMGFEVAASGRFGDADFAYIDTSPAVGHMTEILPDNETIRSFFGRVRSAAEGWDGKDIVREMD